jgi:serine protease Do
MISFLVNDAGLKFKQTIAITSIICVSLFGTLNPVHADTSGLPDFEALVEEQGKAVVKITVTGVEKTPMASPFSQQLPPQFRHYFDGMPEQNPRLRSGFGSGFIISDDGYIVTNAHVVDGGDTVKVHLSDRREFNANVVGSDARSDIALLKIDADNLPIVTLGDSSDIDIGQWVLAIGSPFGFEHTATQGIVSAVSRSLPDESYVPFIQTDAAVNPGNSGGPLFDLDGEVVGVNSQIYSRSGGYMGLSFAIPVNVVKTVVDQLRDNGYVSRGWLGVAIQGVDQPLAESFGLDRPVGALVSSVTSNSPAEKAGMQSGDIILSFNGTQVERSSELPPLVGLVTVDEKVDVEVLRQNKRKTLLVTIGELEDELALNAKRKLEHTGESSSSLGIAATNLLAEQSEKFGGKGIVINAVRPDGPAAKAGIREGDILLSFNQIEISSVKQLRELVKQAPKNAPLAVLLHRGESPLFTALNLS